MRGAFALGLCTLAFVPVAAATRGTTAQYVPPTITEIEATFVEAERLTRYAVEVTYDKNDGAPLFKWGLTPPYNEPHCDKLLGAQQRGTVRDAGAGRLTARSTATWHHSDGDGCQHRTFQHYGWVDVIVYVHHTEKYGQFNLQCSAQYFGTLTGSGKDGGRQEATCDSAVPPPKHLPVGRLTIDFKTKAEIEAAAAADLIDTYTIEGFLFGACALVPATALPCGMAAVVTAALVFTLTKEKEAWEKLVKDPPDPNFRVVAKPTPIKVPPLSGVDGVPAAVAGAFNALAGASARTWSLGEALMTSLDRQLGAQKAGDATSQRMQAEAATRYARQLGSALRRLAPTRTRLRSALVAAGVDLSVKPAEFAAARQKLRSAGLPEQATTILRKLGMTDTDIARLKQTAPRRRPPAYALVFPAMIDNPGLNRLDAAAAAALDRYSRLPK